MNSIDNMKIGDKKIITNISNDLNIKKRLLELGVTNGEVIECVLINPFKNMIAYKIKETILAIRKEDGKKIFIGDNYA